MEFKQGQLAVTTHCRRAWNRGNLVVVTFVNHDQTDSRGRATPYLVQRIDGLQFRCSIDPNTSTPQFAQEARVWARADQLRAIDFDEAVEACERVVGVEA